jgi:hypothetical protein
LRGASLLLLAAFTAAGGCAHTVDHQSELLLHPSPWVQAPALVGALPGTLVGSPVWGAAALIFGPESEVAGYAHHLFAYPGTLLLSVLPWWIAGPSYEQLVRPGDGDRDDAGWRYLTRVARTGSSAGDLK